MNPCLPVVLFQAPHEKRAVERLVRFCKELDGTEIRVFTAPEPENMRYPEVANYSFRIVAKEMQGSPFLWLEADCYPKVAGWANRIAEEYERIGKPYLYAEMYGSEFDRFSGIGVQGPNAYENAPVFYKDGGFDQWIVEKYPDLVGRTSLIQHMYGKYSSNGQVTLLRFPQDNDILNPDAVLFHKDQMQDQIRMSHPHLFA